MKLPDKLLLALYSAWSEDFWAASFMHPSPEIVEDFRGWIADYSESATDLGGPTGELRDYEVRFLAEYHRQEVLEKATAKAAGKSGRTEVPIKGGKRLDATTSRGKAPTISVRSSLGAEE